MSWGYIEKIKELLEKIETQELDAMNRAVELFTSAIMKKSSIFIFGASHAGILSEEMYYRAGGLVTITPIFGRELMLDTVPVSHTSRMERLVGYGTALMENVVIREGDVMIVHSVSGRNPVSIEVAMEAKKRGATVIALTNVKYSQTVTSRHPSGQRLFEVADLVLDNHGDIGDACVSLPGLEQKVAATSTVIGATILNSIISKTAEELIAGGMKNPPIFYSANLDGGDDLNKQIVDEYKDNIHYRFY